MSTSSEQLMLSLIEKISQIITSESAISGPRRYISWITPGYIFDTENDLSFLLKRGAPKDGDEALKFLEQSQRFSTLLNGVATFTDFLDEERKNPIHIPSDQKIEDLYKLVLNHCEVADDGISEEQQAKIEKYRSWIVTEEEEEDLITGDKKIVTKDGKMKVQYDLYASEYDNGLIEYNGYRLDGMNAASKEAVQKWSVNAKTYQNQLERKFQDWIAKGYKNEYEEAVAFISQVTEKSLILYKEEIKRQFELSLLNDPNTGIAFAPSYIYPTSFLLEDSRWSKFGYKEAEAQTYKSFSNTSAKSKASFLGMFSIGAKGEGGKKEEKNTYSFESFEIEFEITKVVISRPWLSLVFLQSNGWRLGRNAPFPALSDNKIPPEGAFPGYNTTATFIRNVKLKFDDVDKLYNQIETNAKAGVTVGMGLFSFGAEVSHEQGSTTNKVHMKEGYLIIPSMQLVAFEGNYFKATPNPNPDVKVWT